MTIKEKMYRYAFSIPIMELVAGKHHQEERHSIVGYAMSVHVER